jgi:hypothetical protein
MIRIARPFSTAALLVSVAALAACGAPRPADPGPLAGAELTDPNLGAEAPPELLGAPEELAALPETSMSPPGDVPPPPPVGNYVLTVPDPAASVGPGGPVGPQPYGLAAAQPGSDAQRAPALPRVYGRVTPPSPPLLGAPASSPAPSLSPAPREYASADVIGRPALPRSYGSRLAPTLSDVPPTSRSAPPPVVVAMAPIPDDVRVPASPARPAAAPRSAPSPMVMAMAPIPDGVRVPTSPAPPAAAPRNAPAAAPMVMAMAPIPNDVRVGGGSGRAYPPARANAPEPVTGPSGNAPAFDPAQQTEALARADARAPAAAGEAPVSPPPVARAAAQSAPAQAAVAATAAVPQGPAAREARAAAPATARGADAAPRPRTPASTPERAAAAEAPATTTAVTAASTPVTNGGAEASSGARVPAGVWWALCLLAAGLIAVVLLVSRPDKPKRASA